MVHFRNIYKYYQEKLKNMRKNLYSIILIVSFVLLISLSVFAAPALEFFVINEQNRQCGIYWPGDEFKQYELPLGWKIYEPESRVILETPFGTCDFIFDVYAATEYEAQDEYYKQCCNKLGFNYVNHYENPISYNNNTLELDGRQWYCSPKIGKEKYQGILINNQTNECRPLIGFNLYGVDRGMRTPSDDQCYITDHNWTTYEYPLDEEIYKRIISTPFGDCVNQKSFTSCCDELGLENVARDLNKNLNYLKYQNLKSYSIIILSIFVATIISLVFLWFFLIKRRQK